MTTSFSSYTARAFLIASIAILTDFLESLRKVFEVLVHPLTMLRGEVDDHEDYDDPEEEDPDSEHDECITPPGYSAEHVNLLGCERHPDT